MKSLERCPLCESRMAESSVVLFQSVDYISGDAFSVLKCGDCGMLYTDPCPDREDEFGRYYPKEDYYGTDEGKRFIPIMEQMVFAFRMLRARRILGFRERGRALDIGCGRGLLLRLLKSRGWDCHGTELSESLASFITENYGIDVRPRSVAECGFPDKMFDVVTIYHVLEHMTNPKDTIREVRRVIKDDGMLIVGVPNASSFQSAISGPKWFHLDVPRHAVHFSPRTLKRMVEDRGFEIVANRSFSAEYDPYGLIQSILNVLGCEPNFLYELLRRKRIDRRDAKTLLYDLPLSLLLPVLLLAPAFALEFVLSFIGMNGTMEIQCRPAEGFDVRRSRFG